MKVDSQLSRSGEWVLMPASDLRQKLTMHLPGMPALPPPKAQRCSSAGPPRAAPPEAAKPGSGRLTQAAITQSTGALGLDHLPDEVRSALWPASRRRSASQEKASALNVPAFAFKLSDGSWRDRRDALQNLRSTGKDSEIALPKLAQSLEDSNALVRKEAADTMASLGTELGVTKQVGAEAVVRLASEDLAVRRAAQKPVEKMLTDGVAEDLSELAAPAVPELVEKLKSESWGVREHTARAIGKLGVAGVTGVSELAKLYADEAYSVRAAAKHAIQDIYTSGAIIDLGASSAQAVPMLTERLSHGDWRVRAAAANGLGVFAGPAIAGVPELTKVSADKSARPQVRLIAISTLGDLGSLSLPAVVELAELTEDPNAGVREVANKAIDAIHAMCQAFCPSSPSGSKASKKRLQGIIDQRAEVKVAAIDNMAKDAAVTAESILSLMASISDEDVDVRRAAKAALQRLRDLGALVDIANSGAQVFPQMVAALSDSAWQVRSATLEALSFLVAIGTEPMQRLNAVAKDVAGDVQTRQDVAELCEQLKKAGALVDKPQAMATIVPHLVEQLADESPSMHSVAREVLSKLLTFDKKMVHAFLVKSVIQLMDLAEASTTAEGREKSARKLHSLENVLAPALEEAKKRRQRTLNRSPSIADEERGLREALADAATNVHRARLLGVPIDRFDAVERRLQKCRALQIDADLLTWAEVEFNRLHDEANTIQVVIVDRPRSADSKASRLSNDSQVSRASRNSFQRGAKRPPSDEGATIWRAVFNALEKCDYGSATQSRLQVAYEAYERDNRGHLDLEDVKAAMQDCSMALMYVCIRRLQMLQLWQMKQQTRIDLLDEQVVWCTEELGRLQNSAEGHIPKEVVRKFARRLGADQDKRVSHEAFMEQALSAFFDGLPKPLLAERLTEAEQASVRQAFAALDVRRKGRVAAADIMMALQLSGFRSRFGAFAGVEMELMGLVLSHAPFLDLSQFEVLMCRHKLLHLGETMAVVARLERAIAWNNKEELRYCVQKARAVNVPEHILNEAQNALNRLDKKGESREGARKDKDKVNTQQIWRLLFGKIERGDKDVRAPRELETLYLAYDKESCGHLVQQDIGLMIRDCSKSLATLCRKRLDMMEEWWRECQEKQKGLAIGSLEEVEMGKNAARLRQQVAWCREQLAGFQQASSEGAPPALLKDTIVKLGSTDSGQTVPQQPFVANAMDVFYEGAVLPQDPQPVTEAQLSMLKGVFDKLVEAGNGTCSCGVVLDWLLGKGYRSAFGAFSGIELELLWRHQHKHELHDVAQLVEVLSRHSVLPLLVG